MNSIHMNSLKDVVVFSDQIIKMKLLIIHFVLLVKDGFYRRDCKTSP